MNAPLHSLDALAGVVLAVGLAAGCGASVEPVDEAGDPPATLRETGLYVDAELDVVRGDVVEFAPQYPLWTDGARKRRWIHVPAGAAIDASQVDVWDFPVGTRLWKEFSFARRVETRYMERLASGWRYATYVWSADERDAVLAPARGLVVSVDGGAAAGYEIPGEADCRACHDGAHAVLGFSALQLSPDRDPLALHATAAPAGGDLPALVDRGLLRGLPAPLLRDAPRIAARTPIERAALGYLHGNCGGCHRSDGALAAVGMSLAYLLEEPDDAADALRTTVGQPSGFVPAGADAALRIAPGDPAQSVLLARLRARDPLTQMPPLGSRAVDDAAVALFERWITELGAEPSSR